MAPKYFNLKKTLTYILFVKEKGRIYHLHFYLHFVLIYTKTVLLQIRKKRHF